MFRWILKSIFLAWFVVGCARADASLAPTPTPANLASALVFVEPEAGLSPVLYTLNAATKSIRLQAHWLTEKEMLDALKAARGRGVDVRVMLENQPLGTNASNRATISALQSAGVNVRTSHAAFKLSYATFVIVDDRAALVMTFDATRASWTETRGFGVRVTQPAQIVELAVVFESDWKRAPVAPVNPLLAWSAVNARQRLYALIDAAQQSLDIECEAWKDDELDARLLNALQRGVTVRLITSPDPTGDATPGWLPKFTRAGMLARLVKTPDIHGTLILADNTRAFVGSTRLTSAALDTHRDVGVLLDDAASVQTLTATFAHDWNIGK